MSQNQQRLQKVIFEPDGQILERARVAAARLAERAYAVDQAREVPPESVRDLHEAGLLTMCLPRDQGGTEADLVTQFSVYEMIGGACGSTAWCLGNHNAVVERIQVTLGDRSRPYVQAMVEEGAALAQGIIPAGTTRAVPSGFVCTGRWPFVSFSNRARWVFLRTRVPGPPPGWQPADGVLEPPGSHIRELVVPIDCPGLHIEPTWQAMSVRASMSNDVVLDEVFIPEEQTIVSWSPPSGAPWNPMAPVALRTPARISVNGPSMALGIAQAALRETIDYAKAGTMSLGGQPRSSMLANQFAVADASILIESSRAFMHQEIQGMMSKVEAGEPCTESDQIRWRMASVAARENAQKVVNELFAIRGAHGLYESANFERYYRDVRMSTLVAVYAPNLVQEQIGKHLFDIPVVGDPQLE